MHTQILGRSPRNHRGGQVSHLLLAEGQFGSKNLAITWVEGEAGSEQPTHVHETNEQVYVIVRGRGLMRVGDEQQEVEGGTLVFVPPNTGHSIKNSGTEPLVFISATAPPFQADALQGTVFAYEPAPR